MKNRLLPLVLILLVAGLLALLVQDLARQLIVTPLLLLYWVGRLLFESIPQIIIWWLFLFIALLAAGRSLFQHRRAQPRPPKKKKTNPERIENWVKLLQDADQETYYKWQLAQHMQELILAALAYHERLTPKEIRHRLAEEKLEIPPEIRAYLEASMTSFSHLIGPRSLFRPEARATPLELEMEQIIQFLEDKVDPKRN